MLSRWVITLPEQLFPFSIQGLETDDRTVSLAACFEFLFDFRIKVEPMDEHSKVLQ